MDKYIITGASGAYGTGLIKAFIKYDVNPNQIIGIYNKNKPNNCIPCNLNFLDGKRDYTKLFSFINENDKLNIINYAGKSHSKPFHKYSNKDLYNMFMVNFFGGVELISELWPHMKLNNYGRIVFISSIVAQKPMFGTFGYCASKAALFGATKELAIEGGKYNICVGNIASGYSNIGIIDDVSFDIQQQLKKQSVLGRFVTIEEIFNAILFFIETPYATGQTISLNGGMYFE